MDNLLSALEAVTNWKSLGAWLDVSKSRREKMTGKEDMLQEWLGHHPCPSWKFVAWALYRRRDVTEHRVLKQLYDKHVTGMWLCAVVLHIVLIIKTLLLYANVCQLVHKRLKLLISYESVLCQYQVVITL